MQDVPSECDVIVVGGGGSGLAAAVSAAENGCSVTVFEKQTHLGGTTGIAVGSITAAGTSIQRRAGIVDQADAHATDVVGFAPPGLEARNNQHLRKYFLDQAAETIEWLRSMGLAFQGPNPEPPNRVPRMHNVIPGARALIDALESRLKNLSGRIYCGAIVTELLHSDGCVTGVVINCNGHSKSITARYGVVLAAGDYANASDLIAEFKGPQYCAIEGINPNAGGDGHRLARAVGAQLCNMDITYGPELRFVAPPHATSPAWWAAAKRWAPAVSWCLPWVPRAFLTPLIKRLLVTWQHPEGKLFADGAILLNEEGSRFCNELQAPELAVAQQPNKVAYLLLDQRLIDRYSRWPHFVSTAPAIAYAYVQDYVRLRPDVAIMATRIEDIARARNLPVDRTRQAIEQFNAFASGHSEDLYGRTGPAFPLQGARWALLGPVKAYFTTTEGGVVINERLQALGVDNQPISGLYAVGQNGLGGQILWGHGLHIAWAVTSGRLVGRELGEKKRASTVGLPDPNQDEMNRQEVDATNELSDDRCAFPTR